MLEEFLIQNQLLILLALAWVLPWKGIALWRAARNDQKSWFWFVLVVNTLGLLEILYIFVFAKKKAEDPTAAEKAAAEKTQA